MEYMFKRGTVSILVATSTLAAGVNLPAGRVIIRSMHVGRETLGPVQYKQMCGRAGRPGLVAFGECYLVVKSSELALAVRLCNAPLPVIHSQIRPSVDGGKALLRVLLELFALGLCDNDDDVLAYVRHTLAYHESISRHGEPTPSGVDNTACMSDVNALMSDALYLLRFLEVACALESSVVPAPSALHGSPHNTTTRLDRSNDTGAPTPTPTQTICITRFGRAIVESGLNPDEAIVMYEDLMRAREQGMNLETNLHLLYLVTPLTQHSLTPDFRKLWGVRENAAKRKTDPTGAHFEHIGIDEGKLFRWSHQPPKRDDIAQCADKLRHHRVQVENSRIEGASHGDQIANSKSSRLAESDWVCLCRCTRLWAASALNMLIDCQSPATVAATYGVTVADISILQRNALFLSFRLIKFCKEIGWISLEKILNYANSCLAVQGKPTEESLQLMCIPQMTPKLANVLVECGYTSVYQVACAKREVLTQRLLLSRQFEVQVTARYIIVHHVCIVQVRCDLFYLELAGFQPALCHGRGVIGPC